MNSGQKIIRKDRVRRISGTFAAIEHRFLRDGFFEILSADELKLYVFLLLAGNKDGISWYGYDAICKKLDLILDAYITARNGLMDKDLIAFDGRVFQVLSLPKNPVNRHPKRPEQSRLGQNNLIHISEILSEMFFQINGIKRK